MTLASAGSIAPNIPKPLKRKPDDEPTLPKKAVKKAKASFVADGDHGDDKNEGVEGNSGPGAIHGDSGQFEVDELGDRQHVHDDEVHEAERPQRNLMGEWLDNSIRLSSDGVEEMVGEAPVLKVEEVEQGEKGADEVDEVYVDTEEYFNGQRVGKPSEWNQTWESNGFFDPILDIYSLNEAVQLQKDLEKLESELIIRDRIPWEKLRGWLCNLCHSIVDEYLLHDDRRLPEGLVPAERDVETRPSLGTLGGFDYFLGLPTLEELAKKQRDLETLRMMRPICQKFALEVPEPKLCEHCDNNLRRRGKLPAKIRASAPPSLKQVDQPQASTAVPKLLPKDKAPMDPPAHVPADQSEKKPNVQKPEPASVPEQSSPLAIDPPQKTPPKNASPKKVTSKKAPTPGPIAPDEPQPPGHADRPKRKGPAPKPVIPEEPQPPAPGGKPKEPKKKDPIPGPSAPKKAEPIQPAAAEEPRKKPGRTRKNDIPDPPPTSPEPPNQEVAKAEVPIEATGPIQQVMGSLPGKPKGHDYYCAICYTDLTRLGSAKKLEHVGKCGTTLGEVKVMTKAQAKASKAIKAGK